MSSPIKKALLKSAAAAMVIPISMGLTSCAASGAGRDVRGGLSDLHGALTSIRGVEVAEINPSSDGSPFRRNMNIVLYVSDMSPAAVTPIVEKTLAETWKFDAFIPVGYSVDVWPAPVPGPTKYDDTRFDLEQIRPALGLTGGDVYSRKLYVDASVLEAKFGPRH